MNFLLLLPGSGAALYTQSLKLQKRLELSTVNFVRSANLLSYQIHLWLRERKGKGVQEVSQVEKAWYVGNLTVVNDSNYLSVSPSIRTTSARHCHSSAVCLERRK